MSVHYKFKSALSFDTVTFDGLHISVSDLKKAITHQKRLGKTVDFDLQITNAQTKEEYSDNTTLIPKNTSLIVARIPLAVQPKKQWDIQAEKQQAIRHNVPEPDGGALDLSQMNGTEEDKIQAMMIQSTMDYDPNNYQMIRGQSQTGEVPANYRCFKCRKPGHWIKNCPQSSNGEVNDFKRNTGIPRSFIERDSHDKNAPVNSEPKQPAVVEKKQEIPDDLICAICKDLFTDAVMIPCCGSSFCDECVRTSLLESEDNECPDCNEKGSSPGSLIPNRFLRNSVNAFRNETGYNKPRQPKPAPKPKDVKETSEEIHEKKEENEPKDQNLELKISEKEKHPERQSSKEASSSNEKSSSKDKKESDGHDKKADPGHHSSHDEFESDFEDNITVTVPPAHLISHQRSGYRERHYNGRHSRHLKPPGMENSPKSNSNSQSTPSREEQAGTPTIDEKEAMAAQQHHEHLKQQQQQQQQQQHPILSHQPPLQHRGDQMRPHRSTPSDMYGNPPPITTYPPNQPPIMDPGRQFMGPYGPPPGAGYPPFMMDNRMRGPFHPIRPGYPQPHQMRPRLMVPPGSLASVYQGVAAKVGPGIIDDPLEAFNRIMREKEKRKEERRRSPIDNRRRSRSIEMNMNRGRGHSPQLMHHGRPQRVRTPDDSRRMRSPLMRDRRGRSRDKRSPEKEKRRHRSSSFSDRSSRSRSWSNSRKRSKSPMMRRRSRSRSQSFSMSRYRQKENRRPERRDDFPPRDDFRERSPGNYIQRQARNRGRMQTPPPQHNPFFRQDRPGHGPDQYFNMPPGPVSYNEGPSYTQNNNRYQDRHGQPSHRDQYLRDHRGGADYKMDRFDDGPPGTDEPPPPGFETSPQRERRSSWGNMNPFEDRDRGFRPDFRKDGGSRKDFIARGHTPDGHEKHSLDRDREDRRHHEHRERDGRSWSRTSRHSSNQTHSFDKRRRSRSKTPNRQERAQEQYSGRDHGSKDRHTNKEHAGGSRDRQIHANDRDKIEHEKRRDREDRDKKNAEREKREQERKVQEKENKRAAKEEREREKEKEKEREREKEKEKEKEKDKDKDKKKESSEDEKKDKKSKEKRKKKKEKDPERKKNKKEKKEKERKEREKEKEKEKEKDKEAKKEVEQESKIAEEFQLEHNRHHQQHHHHDHHTEKRELLPDEQLFNPPPPAPHPTNEELDSTMEEGEIPDNDQDDDENVKSKDSEIIDLYGDICQDEEIKYDYSNPTDENNGSDSKSQHQDHLVHKSSPPDFKRFDSVLDIHANLDFEPDLDEMENIEPKKEANPFAPLLPELSKWERDEENMQGSKEERNRSSSPDGTDEKLGKVTTEVLKRAENAIFARAINAIRPIEIKKISVERQKLYSNENASIDMSPVSSVLVQAKSPNPEMATFQITVPANSNAERSVEIKSEKQKSVKDRLGSKIMEPVAKRHKSNSQSPVRKIAIEGSRIEKVRIDRSRSRDGAFRRDDREIRRISEIKRVHDIGMNRPRDRMQSDFKGNDFNRGRDQRGRGFDRRREFGQDRGLGARGDRMWEQDRSRDRIRDVRDREKDWGRGDNKMRDRFNQRDNDRIFGGLGNDPRHRDCNKSREYEKPKQNESKRDQSPSLNSEKNRRDKVSKSEKDGKRKHGEVHTKSPEKKAKRDRSKDKDKPNSSNDKALQRKKSIIDEANFVPDYDEQIDNSSNTNLKPTTETPTDKRVERLRDESKDSGGTRKSKDKTKTPEAGMVMKRSRSASVSSSSSSSSDSESDSDSDDNKKKKKQKHKKNKKKSRRSSSIESGASTKHKRSKSKKKNKSSKKKKRSKK